MNEEANYVRTQPTWPWHMLWLPTPKTCLLDPNLLFFCSGKLGGGGVKVSRRWNVTTLNNFLAWDLLTLYTVVWFGQEIWTEEVEYAFCWLQGIGIKPPSLDVGCRWFPKPTGWSRSKVWEMWSPWMPQVYVSLGGGLGSWCALALCFLGAADTQGPWLLPCVRGVGWRLFSRGLFRSIKVISMPWVHACVSCLSLWLNSVPGHTMSLAGDVQLSADCHLYFGLILGATKLNTPCAIAKAGSALAAKSLNIQLCMW